MLSELFQWHWRLNTSKVKEATKKWEEKPGKAKWRCFNQSSFVGQEAIKLQGFVDDIKEVLQMFNVSGSPSKHTLLISMANRHQQTKLFDNS